MLDMVTNGGCDVLHKLTCPLCLSPDNVMNWNAKYPQESEHANLQLPKRLEED